MGIEKSILLGVIQGMTEFLPISSSAHLVFTKHILKIEPNIQFDIFLHLGTLIALFLFFSKKIAKVFRDRRYLLLIFVGTVPTGIIGLSFKDRFEALFSEPNSVGALLIVTGALLFFTKKSSEKKVLPNIRDAIIIGIFQGMAVAPGISRSGACISSGLFLGLKREEAFDFAFILAFPAVICAFLLTAKDAASVMVSAEYIAGGISAFWTGLLSLFFLSRVVRSGKVHCFAYYCWMAGLFGLCVM